MRTSSKEGGQQKLCTHQLEDVNHFTSEFDGFSRAILEDKPSPTPAEEGLADMRVVVTIHESITSAQPVKIDRS